MPSSKRHFPEKIRILHVINWFRRGGVETQLLRILRSYDRNCFHMDACVIGDEEGYLSDEARSYGAEILACRRSPDLLSFSARFAELLRGRDYDIVHSHGEAWSGAILRGAHMAGVKVRIGHIRNMVPEGEGLSHTFPGRVAAAIIVAWGRYWLRRYATHILAVSASVMDLRWSHWRDRPERFVVWTGGVDTRRFTPPPNGRNYEDKDPVLIYVASFRSHKRQEVLLDIFASVLEKIPTAQLLLLGEGDRLADIKKLAENLGISSSVQFLGLKDRSTVIQYLHGATLFVSSSMAEGLPNALLEAQAVGLPVAAGDIGPHREVLAPEYHPFLFPLDGKKKATESILSILKDPSLRRRLGEAGRKHVCDNYDCRTLLKVLQEYYCSWFAEANEKHRKEFSLKA